MYKILILNWWKEKVKSSRWRSQFTSWFPTIEDELVSMFSGILFTRYKCLSRICCIIILLCFVLFSDHIIISNDSVQPSSSVEFDDSAIINSSKVVYSSSSIITSTFCPNLSINETTAQQNQSDLHSKCTRNQEFENRYSPYTIPWSTIKHLYVNFKLQVLRHDRKKKRISCFELFLSSQMTAWANSIQLFRISALVSFRKKILRKMKLSCSFMMQIAKEKAIISF